MEIAKISPYCILNNGHNKQIPKDKLEYKDKPLTFKLIF